MYDGQQLVEQYELIAGSRGRVVDLKKVIFSRWSFCPF